MADVELDVTFESSNVSLDTDFGSVYVIDGNTAVKVIANKYSSDRTYTVDEYVIHESLLYRCITEIDEPEEFDSEKWLNIKLADDVQSVKSALDTLSGVVDSKANSADVASALANKMDKTDPTGSGSLSLNRKPGDIGSRSVAVGDGNTASGSASFAAGRSTVANHRSQHVFGEFNTPDDSTVSAAGRGNYIEIIGNGTGIRARSNARTLDWEGNESIAGDLTFNGSTSLTAEIDRLDDKIDDLPEPMIYKGTLGTGGTIETLPAADAAHEGYTYKVITEGTYAGQAAKIGDTFTCCKPEGAPAFTWVLFSQGDTDTWRNIKVNGTEVIGSGISSGAVDFIGSENIEIEYESTGNKIKAKTKNLYTKEEVDGLIEEAVYDLLPSDTESGPIANFETDLALPIKSAIFDVNAIQDLHGQSGAYPAGGGINQWDGEWEIGGISDATGLDYDRADSWRTKGYIPILPNTSYYISSPTGTTGNTVRLRFYDSDKTYIGYAVASGNGAVNRSFVSPANATFVRFNPPAENCPNHDISLNYPATDTAYHPYANICPISGKSEVNTYQSGKNLFDIDYLTASNITIQDGVASGTATSFYQGFGRNQNGLKNILRFKPNERYTLSFKAKTDGNDNAEHRNGLMFVFHYTDDTTTSGLAFNDDLDYREVKLTSLANKTIDFIFITYGYTGQNIWHVKDVQLEEGSEATAYEPYAGTTEVIELGGTYYGGRLLQDKDGHRRFEVTHEHETNMGQYNYEYVSASNCFRTMNFNKAYKRTAYTIIANSLCSRYGGAKLQEVLNQSAKNSTYAFGIVGLYNGSVLFRNTNYTDATAFKSSMQGVTMTFELETPYTIDLPDGEPITTFIGTNNIYADSGDTAVEFKESINQKIASLHALILNA